MKKRFIKGLGYFPRLFFSNLLPFFRFFTRIPKLLFFRFIFRRKERIRLLPFAGFGNNLKQNGEAMRSVADLEIGYGASKIFLKNFPQRRGYTHFLLKFTLFFNENALFFRPEWGDSPFSHNPRIRHCMQLLYYGVDFLLNRK